MTLRKKMIVAFSTLMLVTLLAFGVVYCRATIKNYTETEKQNLCMTADNYAQQFQANLDQMEQAIQQIISDDKILKAIWNLSYEEHGMINTDSTYRSTVDTIRTGLNSDYFKRNFNRVVHFTQNGSVISGTSYNYNPVDRDKNIHNLEWLDRMNGKRGQYVILGEHLDDWITKDAKQVISVVKQIVGENLGYIEVQKAVDILDESYVPGNENWELVLCQDEDVIYRSNHTDENTDEQLILQELQEIGKQNLTKAQIETNNGHLMAISKSFDDGVYAILIDNTVVLRRAVSSILPITLLLVLVLGCVAFVCIFILSQRITVPILWLKKQMEQTTIDNMQITENGEAVDKEFLQLFDSYKSVLIKLNQSIQKERMLSDMQRQAQFDLLQAQVNPHFLFNILNVISSRGVVADDEVICDICADLAQMLRYSTDISEKKAKLKEELHYLELYLELLKFRYEDWLEYKIEIDEQMAELEIPKMVLQQIVENSIAHGYQNVDKKKKLEIIGSVGMQDWKITVRDNGTGISEDKKKEIQKKCEEVRRALSNERRHVEMSIGGMGLVNTYARLYQIYGESFFMELYSQGEGTQVIIGVRTQEE